MQDLREEIVGLLKHAMGIDQADNLKAEQTADSVMKKLIEREQRELLLSSKNETSANLFDLLKQQINRKKLIIGRKIR